MENQIYINDIIINSANAALKIQKKNGSFPSGHNGPWNNQVTPVRTTSHWAILLLKAYNLTNNEKFKNSSEKAYQYLTSKEIRPKNFSFHCIFSESKNTQVNGLIGQAWVIESLIEAYKYLKKSIYLTLSEELILNHSFNGDLCLWNILGLNGESLKVHRVFNQQVWFTVLAFKIAKLSNNKEILSKTNMFFKKLPLFIDFKKYIGMRINETVFKKNSKLLKYGSNRMKTLIGSRSINKRAKGYLAFSLYILAYLFEIDSSLELWENEEFKERLIASLKYLDEEIFNDDNNEFGFQYNPIGFEVAYVKEVFAEYLANYKGKAIEEWIVKQLNNHYNFEKMMLIKNTNDQCTLAARIYELTRMKNRLLSK